MPAQPSTIPATRLSRLLASISSVLTAERYKMRYKTTPDLAKIASNFSV
jgi:hypothetical protein